MMNKRAIQLQFTALMKSGIRSYFQPEHLAGTILNTVELTAARAAPFTGHWSGYGRKPVSSRRDPKDLSASRRLFR